jgi:hypothetical protein
LPNRERGGFPVSKEAAEAMKRGAEHLAKGTAEGVRQKVHATKEFVRHIVDSTEGLAGVVRTEMGETASLYRREFLGTAAHRDVVAYEKFKGAMKDFASRPADENHAFINRLMNGEEQPTEALKKTDAAIQGFFMGLQKELESLPHGAFKNFRDNYFPLIWERPQDVQAWIERGGLKSDFAERKLRQTTTAKKPMSGTGSFKKPKVFQDINQGLKADYKPITDNPVEFVLAAAHQQHAYIEFHRMFDRLQKEGIIHWVPADRRLRFGESIIEGKEFQSILPKSQMKVKVGRQVLGHWVASDDVARIFNNTLHPGLRADHTINALIGLNNSINRFQLGWSGFHFTGSALNNLITENELGARYLAAGKPKEALSHFSSNAPALAGSALGFALGGPVGGVVGTGIGAGVSAFRTVAKARALERSLLEDAYPRDTTPKAIKEAAENEMAAKWFPKGGGRLRMDPRYSNQAISAFQKAVRSGDLLGMGTRLPGAVTELGSKPLMEAVVPRIKVGAFKNIFDYKVSTHKGPLTDVDLRRYAKEAVDHVDNRFGQLVYDNLTWHNTLRDASQAALRSTGWTLGTIKEVFGSPADLPKILADKKLSMRLSYTASLFATTALYGGIMNYMMSGDAPHSPLDCYYPRTGRKNADGTDERWSLPTYVKDALELKQGPLAYLANKASPLIQVVHEIATNKDYQDNDIAQQGDHWYKRGLDLAKHTGDAMLPISYQSMQQHAKDTGSNGADASGLASFMGFNKAPGRITKPAELQYAQDINSRGMGHRNRSPEDQERDRAKSSVMAMIRNGRRKEAEKRMDELKLTDRERAAIEKKVRSTPMQNAVRGMSLTDAMDAYEHSTKATRSELHDMLMEKLDKADERGDLSAAKIRGYAKELAGL